MRSRGGEDVSRQRPDQRLWSDRSGRERADGLVRSLHAQGALPDRREKNDGAAVGRAVRLGTPRRHPPSHQRRQPPASAHFSNCASPTGSSPPIASSSSTPARRRNTSKPSAPTSRA